MCMKEHVEKTDGTTFPGKTFADAVLRPVFNIQREYYYKPFIKISKAHVVMLYEQKIIDLNESKKLIEGLNEIEKKDFSAVEYNTSYEDMFFTVESKLEDIIGEDVAGRLHIARSRNDLDICEFRMVLRVKVIEIMERLNNFRKVLLNLSKEHIETVMPAYTHTQPAQPTTLAHYLLAFYDSLSRDYERIKRVYENINLSPIGAVAITTTGFPINRERMCELLGFNDVIENSYDCIAGSDYLMELASTLMILNTNMSKLIKDTLDFCTKEFNAFYLTDPYVQKSSIMPQKRNPSSLEHTRPMASAAIGEANCVFNMLHNTPFGDIVDTEEQLQPHLYKSIENTIKVLNIFTSVFATMKVNKDLLLNRSKEGFITVTELADTLVREKGLSFRKSHKITASIVKHLINNNLSIGDITPEILDELAQEVGVQELNISPQDISKALDPVNFVNIRKVTGGPAPEETRRMLENREIKIKEDIDFYREISKDLEDSEKILGDTVNNLLLIGI